MVALGFGEFADLLHEGQRLGSRQQVVDHGLGGRLERQGTWRI
jgi:hypothetical protein